MIPPTKIKGIVIRFPWWTEILRGEKTIEYRSWPTAYRGPLAICAAKRPDSGELGGCAVCVVDLVDCVKVGDKDFEWKLENVRPIESVPISGRLGLMDLEIPLNFDWEYEWPVDDTDDFQDEEMKKYKGLEELDHVD